MIHLYCWDGASKTASCPWPSHLTGTASGVKNESVVWVDLEDPTPAEEEDVFRRFLPVHALTFEDITRPRREPDQGAHLPKVEEFPDYLFVIVNPLPWEVCHGTKADPTAYGEPAAPPDPAKKKSMSPGRWKRPQLSAVFTGSVLITHHYDRLPCTDTVRGYVERRGETAGRGPDYLYHLILDQMVDEYAPVVEQFADRLEAIETRVFSKPSPKILSGLLKMKRTVLFLRKTLILEREVLARLTRGEFNLVADREIVYYRNVYDHLVRYTELIEGAREMVSDLMQTYLSAISNRLNEIMKVLTTISIIGMVCTVIAGVYGMNFDTMPELKWKYGYPFSLGLMGVSVVAVLAVLRWKRWV